MIHTFFVQPNVCRPSELRIPRPVRTRYRVDMYRRLAAGGMAVLFFAASATAQQVVFSRRVYAIHGRSFQQLWIWSPSGRNLEPLTRSARDHERPTCSADGKQVFFTSGDGRWQLDRNTGIEKPVTATPRATTAIANEVPRFTVAACDESTWSRSPDGSRLACAANGKDIVIVDLRTQQEIERLPFGQHYSNGEPYPAWPLKSIWSPGAAQLLVGTYGENGSSTSPALDYFLLDLATHEWVRAFTGNDAGWLPDGTAIVFTTPRELVRLPGSSKRVWAAQLAIYDAATRKQTLLASGVTNNIQPIVCPSLGLR